MEMPVPKCPNMCSNMRTHLIMRAKCPEYVHIIDLILIIDLIYVSMNQVLIIDPIIGQIFLECGLFDLTFWLPSFRSASVGVGRNNNTEE